MTETNRTPFTILGIAPGANRDQVRRAYRRLVREWHPDRFADDPRLRRLAEERLKEVNAAYRAVACPCDPSPRPVAVVRQQRWAGFASRPLDEASGTVFPSGRVNFLASWPNRLFLLFFLASMLAAVLLHGISPAAAVYLVQMTSLPTLFAVACRLKLGTAPLLRVVSPLVTLLFLGLLLAETMLHHLAQLRQPVESTSSSADSPSLDRSARPLIGPASRNLPDFSPGRRAPLGPTAPSPPNQPVAPALPLPPSVPAARPHS